MSYTALIEFRNGLPCEEHKYSNSWRGAAYVWGSLFDRYLKRKEFESWLMDSERLWPLVDDATVPEYARLVMAFTFDKALLLRKDFRHFAECLRLFVKEYPSGGDWEPHLVKWADLIESSDAQAFGVHATSVSENLWNPFDEDRDEHVPYNIDTGTDHIDVYEYVRGVDEEEEVTGTTPDLSQVSKEELWEMVKGMLDAIEEHSITDWKPFIGAWRLEYLLSGEHYILVLDDYKYWIPAKHLTFEPEDIIEHVNKPDNWIPLFTEETDEPA